MGGLLVETAQLASRAYSYCTPFTDYRTEPSREPAPLSRTRRLFRPGPARRRGTLGSPSRQSDSWAGHFASSSSTASATPATGGATHGVGDIGGPGDRSPGNADGRDEVTRRPRPLTDRLPPRPTPGRTPEARPRRRRPRPAPGRGAAGPPPPRAGRSPAPGDTPRPAAAPAAPPPCGARPGRRP